MERYKKREGEMELKKGGRAWREGRKEGGREGGRKGGRKERMKSRSAPLSWHVFALQYCPPGTPSIVGR